MKKLKKAIAGWGHYPVRNAFLFRPEQYDSLAVEEVSTIARGLGRSYGDASLNTDNAVILMERLNRFLAFDEKTGVLKAEAGASLADILKVFVPRGWFLPVTPGTKHVTLGGCVAADVHGKNHQTDGSFGKFVTELEILLADGSKKRCSPKQEMDLFWATVGGLGLTGIITEVTLQLIPITTAYMYVQNFPTKNLDETLKILDEIDQKTKYSVAWIDCLSTGENFGRSIIMKARHAIPEELPHVKSNPLLIKSKPIYTVPFRFPSWIINYWTVKCFNAIYYSFQSKRETSNIVSYESFFYPLDALNNWNRLAGKKGFIQYQFVVPNKNGKECLHQFLEELTKNKVASFLGVLKKLGTEGQGMLSFPLEGYTLSVDIPMNSNLLPFLDLLDELVLKYQGRVFLIKDARLKSEKLRAMYPQLTKWQRLKAQVDPKGIFSSDLSRRLSLIGQR
jgi:decaprenylphospho-beta-D-ribofuranose 2-oxidase